MKKVVFMCLLGSCLFAESATVLVPANTPEAALLAPVTPIEPYSISVSKRPFTLPQGAVQTSILGTVSRAPDDYGVSAQLEAGLLDNLQVTLAYNGLAFQNMEWAKSLSPSLQYFVFSAPNVATMLSLGAPIYFEGDALRDLNLNAHTSIGLIPGLSLALFHRNFLKLNLPTKDADAFSLSATLPIRISWQATEPLWVYLGTSLGTLHTDPKKDPSFIWQAAPVYLGGVWGLDSAFDISAEVGVGNALEAKNWNLALGFSYRFGALDG